MLLMGWLSSYYCPAPIVNYTELLYTVLQCTASIECQPRLARLETHGMPARLRISDLTTTWREKRIKEWENSPVLVKCADPSEPWLKHSPAFHRLYTSSATSELCSKDRQLSAWASKFLFFGLVLLPNGPVRAMEARRRWRGVMIGCHSLTNDQVCLVDSPIVLRLLRLLRSTTEQETLHQPIRAKNRQHQVLAPSSPARGRMTMKPFTPSHSIVGRSSHASARCRLVVHPVTQQDAPLDEARPTRAVRRAAARLGLFRT